MYNNKFNVLIIGAGNIGAFYDTPDSNKYLSHAHTFTDLEGFNLVGFIDKDFNKAQKAAQIWNTNVFKNIDEAFESHKIDVVCVSVPDEYHYDVIKQISQYHISLIFAEKPLAKTLHEADEIINIVNRNNIPLAVNYSRRYIPEFIQIKSNIIDGQYGKFITGRAYYGKGLLHNGSHAVDLLRYFIGEIVQVKVIDSLSDYYPDDKSISAALRFEDDQIFYLQYIDCRLYTVFEMDLFFEKKRIRIHDSGFKIEEYDITQSDVFEGYKYPVKVDDILTSLDKATYYSAMNIYNYLVKQESIVCTGYDAYKTLQASLKISESIDNE